MGYRALAFLRRDFQTQASYRLDLILHILRMLVSMAVFYLISRIVGQTASPYLERYGTDYFSFVLLGIAFYPFVTLSSNSLADAVHEYQQTGVLEVLFLSPTPVVASLVMSTLWRYCWALGEALFYLLAASLLFGARFAWANAAGAGLLIVLTVLANAGLGLFHASFVLVTKRASPLARLLDLVTNLLAGVYYPIQLLPPWLRAAGQLLPATHALDALRRIMLEPISPAEIARDLLVLGAFTAILLPLGLISFHWATRWAKADGSLAQY